MTTPEGAEPACRTSPEVRKVGTAVGRGRVERPPRFRRVEASWVSKVCERARGSVRVSTEPRRMDGWVCRVGRESYASKLQNYRGIGNLPY